MTQLKMLSADDKLTEIRRLYFDTTKQSVQDDLAKALDLLKSMATEEERERATVYMEGLAEMRNDWMRDRQPKARGSAKARPVGKGTGATGAGPARSATRPARSGRTSRPGRPAGKKA
jgi:hypothetical protein